MTSARTAGLSVWDHEDAIWREVVLGSRAAFMELLALSQGPMLNYYLRAVPRNLRHLIDPYDLRQQACVQVVVGFERFQPATLAAYHVWRKRIEHRVLAQALRHCAAHEEGCAARPGRLDERGIEAGRRNAAKWERVTRSVIQAIGSPLEAMIAIESEHSLRLAIDALPDMDRQLFIWHARDGLSLAEIARRLGVTKDDARRRYLRIRGLLAKYKAPCQ